MKFTKDDLGCSLRMTDVARKAGLPGATKRNPKGDTGQLRTVYGLAPIITVQRNGVKQVEDYHEDFWEKVVEDAK